MIVTVNRNFDNLKNGVKAIFCCLPEKFKKMFRCGMEVLPNKEKRKSMSRGSMKSRNSVSFKQPSQPEKDEIDEMVSEKAKNKTVENHESMESSL